MTRRQALLAAGALACAPAAIAQPASSANRGLTIAQVVDTSAGQQDVSKDFLIGSRAAWQDINARGGLRGRSVAHVHIEVDGSEASMRAAVAAIAGDPSCIAVSGTAGDAAATRLGAALAQSGLAIAHVAPWLQNSSLPVDERTFPIFATRQEQIGHALRSLTVMGVSEVGAVYASDPDYALYRADIERIASSLKLKVSTFRAQGDLSRLGQRLTPGTPALLLFVGGTPELVQFTQGLERQQRQRYIVALADVNLQTMLQMGGHRATPVIVTQAVPVTTAALPVVRSYRETLSRLFDEPPAALSLAGFIAARYTFEVLKGIDGVLTRAAALAAFQRRAPMDLGGYRVSFDPRGRAGTYVTQSMLTPDGRVIG